MGNKICSSFVKGVHSIQATSYSQYSMQTMKWIELAL